MKRFIVERSIDVPHPVKLVVSELPGLALSKGDYNGFGKKLCIPVESESMEPFEEDSVVEESVETEK